MTNQRETTIVWERATGRPVADAIVWQSRITAPYCEELRARGLEPLIRARTGLPLDAYFSGPKIATSSTLDAGAAGPRRARRARLRHGRHVPAVWRLTGGRVHATDVSNASRTLLFDIHRAAPGTTSCSRRRSSRGRCCPRSAPRAEVYGETDARAVRRGRSRSPASPATSRRPRSARPASRRARPRTPTAPARSCCSNTGERRSSLDERAADDRSPGGSGPARPSPTPSRAPCSWPARPSSGCATGCGPIERAAEIERLAADASPTPAASTSCRRSSASGRRTGTPTPAARIVGLTRGRGWPRSPARRSTRWPTRWPTSSGRWRPTRDRRSTSSASTAERPGNDALSSSRPTSSASRSSGRSIAETTALGAAGLAGLAVGSGPTGRDSPRPGRSTGGFEPAMTADRRTELLHGWHRAVERSLAGSSRTERSALAAPGPVSGRASAPHRRLRRRTERAIRHISPLYRARRGPTLRRSNVMGLGRDRTRSSRTDRLLSRLTRETRRIARLPRGVSFRCTTTRP